MINKEAIEKDSNFISVVVYMRNSEESIAKFLEGVDAILFKTFKAYEFILVDDCNEDNTVKFIKELHEKINGNVSIVKMSHYHGLESALWAGVDLSIGDFIYEFDSTNVNYDMNLLLEIYNTSLKGYDVVSASDLNNRRKSSMSFYRFLNRVSYRKMKLESETFRLVSRRAINRTTKGKGRIEYRKALYHYSGLETKVIYYKPINETKVIDNLTFKQRRNLAFDILINHSDIGIRIAGILSIIFLLFAFVTVIYTIIAYVTVDNVQPGWATTMLFLAVSFSGLFIVLFVVSKYLVNILIEVRRNPLYVYKSIDRISKK